MATEVKDIKKHETQEVQHAQTRPRAVYKPRVDIVERENEIVLYADMPGVDEKSVDITVEKSELTIKGKADDTHYVTGKLIHREYGVGDYERVFTLSDRIDREGIKATVKNGVLTLVLPKAEEAKAKKIEVKAS